MRINNQISHLFFSWRLWRHLLHPPEHRVFWRVSKQGLENRPDILGTRLLALIAGIIGYGFYIYLTRLNLLFPVFILIILAIFSSAITLIWIINISLTIAGEYRLATYDLICITPSGPIAANWALACAIVHRHDLFGWIELGRRFLSGLILLILLVILLPIGMSEGWSHLGQVSQLLFDILLLAGFSYIEYVQTVVLGVLVAILVPQYTWKFTNVHIWSICIFIAIQILTLAIFLIASLLVASYSAGFVSATFLLHITREGCIYVLWKRLAHQLNAEMYDFAQS